MDEDRPCPGPWQLSLAFLGVTFEQRISCRGALKAEMAALGSPAAPGLGGKNRARRHLNSRNSSSARRKGSNTWMPGPSGMGGRGFLALALAGAIVWLLSGFYTVGPNEVGLNRIFGRYTGKTGPGLNYNLPVPIGSVERLQVTNRNMINIGSTFRQDSRSSEWADAPRSARRKPDADRRRKHRRRQICRDLANRPGAPRGLCL